jgi:anti-sigma-K factor RskA
MTTDPRREHAPYDELTAGYVLDALDPQDEADFAGHLPDCARCQQAVARFTEITAALAQTAPPAEPDPALGERIMAAVAREPAPPGHAARADWADSDQTDPGQAGRAAGPQPEQPEPPEQPEQPEQPGESRPAAVRRLHGSPRPAAQHRTSRRAGRPRRPLRVAAAGVAAAAALIAGGATYAGLQGGGSVPQPPSAGCAQAQTCREIVLTDASSRTPAARLIVADGTAWLVPSGLKADNTAQQVYVLWQITGGHTPLAVGSFDVRGHHSGNHPIRIGALTVPYSGTWAFAVSLERGRTIPAAPSHPVALGQVPS